MKTFLTPNQYNQIYSESTNILISSKVEEKSYEDGIRRCIEELRKLQEQMNHQRQWNHSRDAKFAPVELSDWLLINVLRKL